MKGAGYCVKRQTTAARHCVREENHEQDKRRHLRWRDLRHLVRSAFSRCPCAGVPEFKRAFRGLKRAANGGTKITFDKLPDWTGIWTRSTEPVFKFDPTQPSVRQTTAQLTPEYAQRHQEKLERVAKGIEWDSISNCIPPGHPRWLTTPFLREFALRPDQTLLINEMLADTRRVYTDGRGHTQDDEAYPLWNGDSIGFWDGDSLVIHTTQLMEWPVPAPTARLQRPGRDGRTVAQDR